MRGDRYLRTVQAVVATAIFELFPKAVPDSEDVIRSHGHVATVIKTMQIAAKQETVIYAMFATARIGHYVGSLQDRCRMLMCDGARTFICISNREAE